MSRREASHAACPSSLSSPSSLFGVEHSQLGAKGVGGHTALDPGRTADLAQLRDGRGATQAVQGSGHPCQGTQHRAAARAGGVGLNQAGEGPAGAWEQTQGTRRSSLPEEVGSWRQSHPDQASIQRQGRKDPQRERSAGLTRPGLSPCGPAMFVALKGSHVPGLQKILQAREGRGRGRLVSANCSIHLQ